MSVELILNQQLQKWESQKRAANNQVEPEIASPPLVTISRQSGSRGSYFGSRLAQRLGCQRLHRKAIYLFCNSSPFNTRLSALLDSSRETELEKSISTVLEKMPDTKDETTCQLCRAILSMAQLGGVVIMGRGANLIIGLNTGFHIRVVSPKPNRIENLMKYKSMDPKEAEALIERSDLTRRKFQSNQFAADIDNPRNYDLVINTALIDIEELVDTTIVAIKGKQNKLTNLDHDQL